MAEPLTPGEERVWRAERVGQAPGAWYSPESVDRLWATLDAARAAAPLDFSVDRSCDDAEVIHGLDHADGRDWTIGELRAYLDFDAARAAAPSGEDHGNPDHPMKQWDAGWQAAFEAIRSGDPDAIKATGLVPPAERDRLRAALEEVGRIASHHRSHQRLEHCMPEEIVAELYDVLAALHSKDGAL